jgi:hypothetical protein
MSSAYPGRIGRAALAVVAIGLCATPAARAIQHDTYKDVRSRYEGLTFRLRVDLHAAGRANDPNVLTLDGMGYPSERSAVLFTSLQNVYVEKVTSEGGTRLSLTIYRNQEEANRMRASAVPAPTMANPNYGSTIAAFARQGSTSVVLQLKAGKKDGPGQRDEIEALLDKLFYLSSQPQREDLEMFVRRHPSLPISQLRATTGLPEEDIRDILKEAAASRPSP